MPSATVPRDGAGMPSAQEPGLQVHSNTSENREPPRSAGKHVARRDRFGWIGAIR